MNLRFLVRSLGNRRAGKLVAGLACVTLFLATRVLAIDPPHNTAALCGSCHIPHSAGDGAITSVAGNGNLCLSCHSTGGSAGTSPFANNDQALPYPGLPPGTNVFGTSHRWNANAAGHVIFVGGSPTPSTGMLIPSGAYTGKFPKTYTITIFASGEVGSALFNWSVSTPGGGSGFALTAGANLTLDEGVSVSFINGTNTSFQAGDQWNLHVRSGLRNPTNTTLLAHMTNGVVSCSACHDEHSQIRTPFGTNVPAFTGPGTGSGRHFMRVNNELNQMCNDCHAPRNVTNSLAGSHPVGITPLTDLFHKQPALLPLETSTTNIGCLSCHQMHHAPGNNGMVLRMTNTLSLCVDCHLNANTATPAAHFFTTNLATLWPGGQYGSQLPARTDPTAAGSCMNCHVVHGWPNSTNTSTVYPHLLADQEEKFCYTCHDADGPSPKNVRDDFQKKYRHPVAVADQVNGRTVGCGDCHNSHKAELGTLVYTDTATSNRNRLTGPLKGVSAVAVSFAGLTNFDVVPTNSFTLRSATVGATYEFEICLKCHSAYSWGSNTPPVGISSNGSIAQPIQTELAQEFSPANKSGHPIVTGLNNYTNSLSVGGRRGLLATALRAPWNVNIGTQTMTCGDCHGSDSAAPAAQGPHGSAAQFMLRGTNANNWPNVTLQNYNSSWCANCHPNSGGDPHGEGNHQTFPCYRCHIVVPHGGKMSRLIADNDSMPVRYAWNNTLNTNYIQAYTKRAVDQYQAVNCRAQCHSVHATNNPAEHW